MKRVHPLAPVVALDIDGTLGDYHGHFTWFAGLYLQDDVEPNWDPEFEGEFSVALGLNKKEYRDIKLAYRQGGMKRCLPAFDMVRELVEDIRYAGYQVWITTTRPWNRLDNIDPDTQFWIDRNIGQIDGVIYGEDKYLDLIDIVGRDRIVCAIDDLPENIIRARELGIPANLRRGEHNKWWTDEEPVANNTQGMYTIVHSWMRQYEATRMGRNAEGHNPGDVQVRAGSGDPGAPCPACRRANQSGSGE